MSIEPCVFVNDFIYKNEQSPIDFESWRHNNGQSSTDATKKD